MVDEFFETLQWKCFISDLLFVKCLQDFICEDGTKIALSTVCNGEIDCPDGSDETKKFCYHVM